MLYPRIKWNKLSLEDNIKCFNYWSNTTHFLLSIYFYGDNLRWFQFSCLVKPLYEETLSENNYKASLEFEKPQYNTKRNRLRKVIWFNPPFSQNVKTNIGKIFLKLVKQHFPKHHKLNKIFNKNTLKLSYCCMKNMSSIIKQHNVNILSAESNVKRSTVFVYELSRIESRCSNLAIFWDISII